MKPFRDPKLLLTQTSLIERFLRYVAIDTQSQEGTFRTPSSDGQWTLARLLVKELTGLGLTDAAVDERCYVTATVPGDDHKGTVGLIAHLDTSPAESGAHVTPIRHLDYDGGDIRLKDGVTILAEENPELQKYIGDTIITSDGTTLLGADDKAGIAVIMAVAEYLMDHAEVPRPRVRIGFTPDEEIGRGTVAFPYDRFGADVAFTLDGSFAGEINIETFEAASARALFQGVATHPGQAKGKLVNALKWMAEFLRRLPDDASPERTSGREGFVHPVSVSGDATACEVALILRDFDPEKLTRSGVFIQSLLDDLTAAEPRLKTRLLIEQSYPNMYRYLEKKPEILARLEQAVRGAGLVPIVLPVRGGTDGAQLTKNGLLCPNIFAGGMNFHDKREWVATRAMALSACTVLNLLMSH